MAPPRQVSQANSPIVPFAVEQWMDAHETTAKYNIAETCCDSVSVEDLLALVAPHPDKTSNETPAKPTTSPLALLSKTKLSYGAIRGSNALRRAIGSLYSAPLDPANVLVTSGAISANFLVLYTLIRPGDHVICMYPTYQQLYSVPASLGASVSKWRLNPDAAWQPSLNDLRALIQPGKTRLIIVNNPNNPTGAVIPTETLKGIVDIARQFGILVLSDEVYAPLFHSLDKDQAPPPSMLDLDYPDVIVTGSLSKAYSLAGIRVGWLASRSSALVEACTAARDYTTISVSQLDDAVATFALSSSGNGGVREALLTRNMALARHNLTILQEFVRKHSSRCGLWTKPQGGTTAFVKFYGDEGENVVSIDDKAFCQKVQDETGVMMVPGSKCFGDGVNFKGYVRIGYACETEVLLEGLEALSKYLACNLC